MIKQAVTKLTFAADYSMQPLCAYVHFAFHLRCNNHIPAYAILGFKVRLVGFTFCVLTPVVLVSQATQLCPGDELCFGCKETEAVRYRVKMVHQSVVEQLSSNSSVSGDGLLNGDGRHSDPDRELIAA